MTITTAWTTTTKGSTATSHRPVFPLPLLGGLAWAGAACATTHAASRVPLRPGPPAPHVAVCRSFGSDLGAPRGPRRFARPDPGRARRESAAHRSPGDQAGARGGEPATTARGHGRLLGESLLGVF